MSFSSLSRGERIALEALLEMRENRSMKAVGLANDGRVWTTQPVKAKKVGLRKMVSFWRSVRTVKGSRY